MATRIPWTDRVGDLGRNTYYGDHRYSWDLRVSRYFLIRERRRLDLMVDAFNLLNRPNVDEVTSVYGAAVICGGTATRTTTRMRPRFRPKRRPSLLTPEPQDPRVLTWRRYLARRFRVVSSARRGPCSTRGSSNSRPSSRSSFQSA